MILPIGHEDQSVRRLPWVSFSIIALCLIIHHFVAKDFRDNLRYRGEKAVELFSYYFQHPYLELKLDVKLERLIFPNQSKEKAIEQLLNEIGSQIEIPDEEIVAGEQANLDNLCKQFNGIFNNIPFFKYGFIPTSKTFKTLITYMFIHGDWLHVIFNMFFFFLCGPFIEDVWGKKAFIAFYLTSGIFAALMFCVHYPRFSGPLIGASGAVAGVMGAFLVRHWKTRIKFVYWVYFLAGTFTAPAWMMLPLWVLLEFANARKLDALKDFEGGGVAHWAHIWGFVAGAGIALLLKYFRFEEKYITPKLDKEDIYVNENYLLFEESVKLYQEGNKEEAWQKIHQAFIGNATDADINQSFWNIGQELNKITEHAPLFMRVIENEIKQNQISSAWTHFLKLKEHHPQARLTAQQSLLILDYLEKIDSKKEANQLLAEIEPIINPQTPIGLLWQFFSITSHLNPQLSLKIAMVLQNHIDLPVQKKTELQKQIKQIQQKIQANPYLQSNRSTIINEKPVQPESAQKAKKIIITHAKPIKLADNNLFIDADKMGHRCLDLKKVRLIAIAKISPAGEIPFLIIDLILKNSASGAPTIGIIRLNSRQFKPETTLPTPVAPSEAWNAFIKHIFSRSQAGIASQIQDNKSKMLLFDSLLDYNHFLHHHPQL